MASAFLPPPPLPLPLPLPLPSRRSPRCLTEPRTPTTLRTRPTRFWRLFSRGMQNTTPHPQPLPLRFSARIPAYLVDYTFLRMTPYIFNLLHKDGVLWSASHWFDAIANVSSFRITSRTGAVFQTLIVNAAYVDAIEGTDASAFRVVRIGPPPRRTWYAVLREMLQWGAPLTKDGSTGKVVQNLCVALERIPTRGLCARTDANVALEIDEKTLKSGAKFSFAAFDRRLSGDASCSHGVWYDGKYFNYVAKHYNMGLHVPYQVFSIDEDGGCEILATFREPFCFVHSLAVTDRYVIMGLWPCHVDIGSMLATRSIVCSSAFKRVSGTKFVVISRAERRVVAEYSYGATFCFHMINAFERGDDVVVDICQYDDISVLGEVCIDSMLAGNGIRSAKPVRYTLPQIGNAESRRALAEGLSEVHVEFPNMHPRFRGREYRYVYGMSDGRRGMMFGDVTKVDVVSGEAVQWREGGVYTGEPVFVPDPEGEFEDCGCVLVMVFDAEKRESALVVLDARDMKEIGRAELGFGQGHGFHACAMKLGM